VYFQLRGQLDPALVTRTPVTHKRAMDGVSTALAQQLTVSEDLPQTESELLQP